MTNTYKAKTKDKEQSKRFIKKAREIGADESGEILEHALKKAVPPKRPTSTGKKDKR